MVGSLVFWIRSCCPKAKHLCQGNVLVCFRAKTKSPIRARSELNQDCTFEGCAHPAKPFKNAQRRQVDMSMYLASSQPLEEVWPSSVSPLSPSALSILAVLPLHPMHVEHCHHFCFTIPTDCSAPILQPSRTEALIKLFENPIKMVYESVCHWQRFREEN